MAGSEMALAFTTLWLIRRCRFNIAIGRSERNPRLRCSVPPGNCFGIRSERRLCEEVRLNVAYRWFCHLGLEDPVPDHSTFSKNRHGRFRDSDTLRFVLEQVLERCVREGWVGGWRRVHHRRQLGEGRC